tara:strand:- start:636 stop:1118 length:483 start_codon:yes stop_codon:yes gene_type:complete
MIVDFKSLNKNSRIWIFQSVTLIDDCIVEIIKKNLTLFLSEWKSHQNNVKSSFEIRSNTFIIIAADESNLVSGCSIDGLVNFIKELEKLYDLQLLDNFHIKFIKNEEISTLHLNEFKSLAKKLKSDQKLIVFNNLINNIEELENNWKVDIRNSWHKRFLT